MAAWISRILHCHVDTRVTLSHLESWAHKLVGWLGAGYLKGFAVDSLIRLGKYGDLWMLRGLEARC